MAQVHSPSKIKCIYCGEQILAVATFCPQCGNDLRVTPTPTAALTAPQNQNFKPFPMPRWALSVILLLLTAFVGTTVYRNIEEARTASSNRKAMESIRESIPAFAPNIDNTEKKGPITESERMERQLMLDTYEKAKREYEQLQRMTAEPNGMVSKESLGMAKSTLDILELSKRQADIEWQRRLENVQ